MTRENPDRLYDIIWRCSDLGIRLGVDDGVLVVSGREADIEPLAGVLWRANAALVRALTEYRGGVR